MMTLSQFEKYRLGIPEIDEDHWAMFKMVERVLGNVKNKEYVLINESLAELMKDFRKHINDEIQLMAEMKFPFIETHIVEHSLLLYALEKEIVNAKFGDYLNLNADVEHLLINHIEQYDRLYADYARLMNISHSLEAL